MANNRALAHWLVAYGGWPFDIRQHLGTIDGRMIAVDAQTWDDIVRAGASVGVPAPALG